jgi:hypothetical protein
MSHANGSTDEKKIFELKMKTMFDDLYPTNKMCGVSESIAEDIIIKDIMRMILIYYDNPMYEDDTMTMLLYYDSKKIRDAYDHFNTKPNILDIYRLKEITNLKGIISSMYENSKKLNGDKFKYFNILENYKNKDTGNAGIMTAVEELSQGEKFVNDNNAFWYFSNIKNIYKTDIKFAGKKV